MKEKSEGFGHSSIATSLIVGSLEATVLHPLGTWIKLYHVRKGSDAVFQGAMNPWQKFKVTCRGIHLAGPNKVISRVLTLGVQPIIKQKIDGHYGEIPTQVLAGVAPSIVSTFMTLPLDTYKSKCQTGVSTRNIRVLLRDSGQAFAPTVTRNLVGMSSLFGGAAFVRQRLSRSSDGCRVTPAQDCVACVSGGVLGAIVSNPPDVIKTQTQMSGQRVLEVMSELGVRGMGRGLGLNLVKGVQRGMVYWLTRQDMFAPPSEATQPVRKVR